MIIRLFTEKIGVQKRDNLIDLSLLEFCIREHLNRIALRKMVVFDPLKIVITNYADEEELLKSENNPEDPDGQYIEQVWKAVHHYSEAITGKKTMLIGDFNSNTIWDRKYRVGNHSAVVKRLEKKSIFSCYHLFHKQIQGKEEHPTFYLYKHKDKPYHLDYCFASTDMADKIQSVEIGDHDRWKQYSDHVPVIVTFDFD